MKKSFSLSLLTMVFSKQKFISLQVLLITTYSWLNEPLGRNFPKDLKVTYNKYCQQNIKKTLTSMLQPAVKDSLVWTGCIIKGSPCNNTSVDCCSLRTAGQAPPTNPLLAVIDGFLLSPPSSLAFALVNSKSRGLCGRSLPCNS